MSQEMLHPRKRKVLVAVAPTSGQREPWRFLIPSEAAECYRNLRAMPGPFIMGLLPPVQAAPNVAFEAAANRSDGDLVYLSLS